MSYETLDSIADSFIPVAFALSLIGIFIAKKPAIARRKVVMSRVLLLFMLLLVAYGGMAIDHLFGLWPRAALDYSTHTAVFLTLCIFLALLFYHSRKIAVGLMLGFFAYCALMRYQEYHSFADMLSTGLAVLIADALLIYGLSAFCCQAFGDVPVFLRNTRASAELSS